MILSSSLDSNHRYDSAEFRRMVYLANGWSSMRRWNGRSAALQTAGIEGPSVEPDSWTPSPTTAAGSTTVGIHAFRYRYQDSRTGYVSNASEEREILVSSGAQQLTFPISSSGVANIIQSSDSKVDRIILEATLAGSADFFTVATVLNTATSVVCNLSDAALQVAFLPYDEIGHDPPPVSRYVVSHRERLWLFGQVTHSVGTVTVAGSSTSVTGVGTGWNTEALGSASGEADVSWFFQVDGDSEAYEVDYASSATGLVLKSNYGGSDASAQGYKIFSRSNVIWVSRAGFPESFIPLKFLTGPSGQGSGDVTAGIGFGPVMVFFSLSGMHRITWDVDPLEDPVITQTSDKRGALNQRVVIEVEGKVYAMDRTGWHVWSGVFPTHISKAVDDFRAQIDFDLSDRFHCVWLPEVRAIRWYVCFVGDDYPKNFLQLDVDTGAWGSGTTEVGISESRLVPTSAGLQVYLGDENGNVWLADVGTCDGVSEELSHLTAASGATTTTVPVNESLPANGGGVAGVVAYHVESGESRLVSSSTPTSLVLAEAFSAAPADGDAIWLGRIPARLKTRAFGARGLREVFRPRYAWLSTEPTSQSRRARVRIYEDLSASQKDSYSNFSQGNNTPGLTLPGNDDDVAGAQDDEYLVHTDYKAGTVRIPFGSEFRRTVELELEVDEPACDYLLSSLVIEGEGTERAAD